MSIHDSIQNGPMKDPIAQAAYARVVSDTKFKEQAKLLQESINDDPGIDDPTNMSVFIKKEKGVETIHLIGKAQSELDMRRAVEVVHEQKTDEQAVDDQLVLA